MLKFIKRHIDKDLYALLRANNVPWAGPDGLRRFIASKSLEAFCFIYFPEKFSLEPPHVHLNLFRDMDDIARRARVGERGVKLARVIPRGHSKTTLLVEMLPLHGALFAWSPLSILLANNGEAAKRLVDKIRAHVEDNALLKEDFGDVRGESWGKEQLTFSNGATIYAFGRGSGAIRGVAKQTRPRLVCADDLDDDQLVRSQAELDAAIEWWNKAVQPVGDQVNFTTSYVVAGTLIRKTSLLQSITDQPDFDVVVEKAIIKPSERQDLWDEWRERFLELAREGKAPKSPDEDEYYQQHRAEMLQGTEVLWPHGERDWDLQVKKLSIGVEAFQSEYQNSPGETGNSLGPITLIPSLPADLKGFKRYGALDSTVKGTARNDLAAWVEILFHPGRRQMFVSHIDAKQRPYPETIDAVMARLRANSYQGLWIETNGSGWVIADLLEDRINKEGLYYIPQRVNHAAKKEERIHSLPEYVARGQLFVLDTVDPELKREWEGFPHYRFDDVLDGIATIVLQLKALGFLDIL